MTQLSDKTVCVCDLGLFCGLAEALAKSFKKTYYFSPAHESGFPQVRPALIGKGLSGVTRVDSIWPVLDDVDLFVFPDVGMGPLQEHIATKLGKSVFGSRIGETLEFDRPGTKTRCEKAGIPIGPWESVRGLTALREHLHKHREVWVKVSRYRGDVESFFSANYRNVEPRLNKIEYDTFPASEDVEFIVEESIEPAVEIGFDAYSVDGQFPTMGLCGIEIKDVCVDDQTEVLTDKGWKRFKDLNRTERFLTLDIQNPKRYRMEYQSATEHIALPYDGLMLAIETQNVELLVTPNHRLIVNDQKHAGRRRILQAAKDIDLSRPFSMPHPKCDNFASGADRTRRFAFGSQVITPRQHAVLMGMFLSEGYVRRKDRPNSRGGGYDIVIAQEKYVEEFGQAIESLPFGFSRTKAGWGSSHRELGEYLLQFGLSADKFVPAEIKNASRAVIEPFLYYYCLGDGTVHDERGIPTRVFYTASQTMADDLQELLVKVGCPASVSYRGDRKMYTVSEHGQHRTNRIYPHQAKWKHYQGMVYCVSVPNQTICVRRNGKVCWTGNCYVGHFTDYADMPKQVRFVNEKLAPMMKAYHYRCFFSSELRITKDGTPFLVDLCCRMPEPPGSLYPVEYKNLPRIIAEAAEGRCIDPDPAAEWVAELVIHSPWGVTRPLALDIEERDRPFVRLRYSTVVRGVPYVLPQPIGLPEVGAVVGVGDTMEKAIKTCTERAARVQGHEVETYGDALPKAEKAIEKLASYGVTL